MKFFDYENHKLTLVDHHILLIKEFADIMNSDDTEDKTHAFKLFQYGYLMCDWQSPYVDFENDFERHEAAIEDCGLSEEDLDNEMVRAMVLKWRKILESNLMLRTLNAMKKSINELIMYFKTVNFTETIQKGPRAGSLKYDPKQYLAIMKEAKFVRDTVKDLEERVKEEMNKEDDDVRGSTKKGSYEY